MKRCSACGETKSLDAFWRNRNTADGRAYYCKMCQTEKARVVRPPHRRRLWRYGLTQERFDAMVAVQDGRCAGCRAPLQPGRAQHIDHCHETGRVRGVLCRNCNHALGQVRDSSETLRRLAAYLERWE